MKVRELKVGDRVENYRVGRIYVITEIGCYHGDEIAFDERMLYAGIVPREVTVRKRLMTFRQFENLKFIRREGDRT